VKIILNEEMVKEAIKHYVQFSRHKYDTDDIELYVETPSGEELELGVFGNLEAKINLKPEE